MTLVKEYICDNSRPTDGEIEQSLSIARRDDCIVRLVWRNGGRPKSFNISRNMSFSDCKYRIELEQRCWGELKWNILK